MSYDLTIRPSRRNAPLKPVAVLEAFLASQPGLRRNGSNSYMLDDGDRWMEIDLEVGGGTGEVLEQVRAHIPYGKLGDHPERDYFPLLKAIAAELKWKLHDEQTEERKDPDFEEAEKEASILFLYRSVAGLDEVSKAFRCVLERGYRITRLGRYDPLKRWKGTDEEAILEAINGLASDGGISFTAQNADGLKLSSTFTLHPESWGEPRFSIPGTMISRDELLLIGQRLVALIPNFLTILGTRNPKNDAIEHWLRIHQSADCPSSLLEKVKFQ